MNEPFDNSSLNRQLLVTLALAGVIVLALGVGFMGGYMVGGRSSGAPAVAVLPAGTGHGEAAHVHGAPGAGPCTYELPEKDRHVLAGLICNCKEAHCNKTPLLACHCETAHEMKSLTKQLIVEGMDFKEIPFELEKRWGPGIRPGT